MSWLTSFWGTEEQRFDRAVKTATAGESKAAIIQFDAIIAQTNCADLKSRCLLNRALAYVALQDVSRALGDLQLATAELGATANVRAAAFEALSDLKYQTDCEID